MISWTFNITDINPRLRQAEERKRLIEEIRQEEVNDHNEDESD